MHQENIWSLQKTSNQNYKYWGRNKSVCGAYKKSGNFCCVTIFENLFIQEERVRTIWEGGGEGVKILHLKLLDIKRVYPYKILLIWFVILIFFYILLSIFLTMHPFIVYIEVPHVVRIIGSSLILNKGAEKWFEMSLYWIVRK